MIFKNNGRGDAVEITKELQKLRRQEQPASRHKNIMRTNIIGWGEEK